MMMRNQESKFKNQGFQCMSEVYEDGKLVHYLQNPTEKDCLKAWKKSEVCTK